MTSRERQTPLGMETELEPEEKENEMKIEFYLEAFFPYIADCIDWRDLIIDYTHFSPDQSRHLRKMCIAEPLKAPAKILQAIIDLKYVPRKYGALVDAMKEAKNEKVVHILSGRGIPTNDHHKALIHKCGRIIYDNVTPLEILPSLLAKGVITEKDQHAIGLKQTKESKWDAVFDLLLILPNKDTHWYRKFIEALKENNHEEMAEKIEAFCENLEKEYRMQLEDLEKEYRMQLEDKWEPTDSINNLSPAKLESMESGTSSVSNSARMSLDLDFGFLLNDDENKTVKSPAKLESMDSGASSVGYFAQMSLDFDSLINDDENKTVKSPVKSQQRDEREEGTETAGEEDAEDQSVGNGVAEEGSVGDNEINPIPNKDPVSAFMEYAQYVRLKVEFIALPKDGPPHKPIFTYAAKLGDMTFSSVKGNSLREVKKKAACVALNYLKKDGKLQTVFPDTQEPEYSSYQILTSKSKAVDCDDTDRVVEGSDDQTKAKSIRDNSQSPVLKELKDKNVMQGHDVDKVGNLNIVATEPVSISVTADEDDDDELEDKDISLRVYQEELAGPAKLGKNVIIVAPTGSGKTRVALRIIQEHIHKQQGRGIAKVIFLVNQVALANQQGEECLRQLPRYTSKVISGESQRSRNECLKDFIDKRDILIVTAQVLLDALIKKEISCISQFSLMVFDECHHTYANHTFNQIMGMYMDLKFQDSKRELLPQIVGLTASVGVGKAKNIEKAVDHIKHLMANLDAQIICTVQANMEELREYVSLPDEETVTVPKRQNDIFGEGVTKLMNTIEIKMASESVVKEMPEASKFETALKSPAQKGSAQYTQWVSKLWKETAKLRSSDARRFLTPCRTHLEYYNNALIIYNDARIEDAITYLDLEMKRWKENAIMDDNEKKLQEQFEKLRKYTFDKNSINPKLEKLRQMIIKAYKGENWENSRGIVFVKTRDLAKAIVSWMKETPGLRELNPIPFVGQNTSVDKGGMTKAEQDDALIYFKDGKHKLIVATSVAEEGLDISKCNLVIRYDHVTNEIAMVQSRGRGRAQDSKYIVLAQQGTGMAEKEELNMIREVMMRKAIIQLQKHITTSPKKFQEELRKLQDEANLERQLKSLGGKRRLIRTGEFELQCLKCSCFICMSSDVKKIQGAHHVVVDESLKERVKYLEVGSSRYTDESIQVFGKIICKECGDSLGVICNHKSLEFPVLKIEKFLIVDVNGRQLTCKRWKGVPFDVSQLGTEDFRDILYARQERGDLD